MTAQLSSGARVDVRAVMGCSTGQAMRMALDFPESEAFTTHAENSKEAEKAVVELLDAIDNYVEADDECAVSYGPDADKALREKIAARGRLDAVLARMEPQS